MTHANDGVAKISRMIIENGLDKGLPNRRIQNCFFVFLILLLQCCWIERADAQAAHDTKLLVGYTAKPLKPGKGYVRMIDGLVYDAEVGITDYFSVGVGTTLIPLSHVTQSGGFKMKLAFPIAENIHLGIGTVFVMGNYKELSIIPTGLVTINLPKAQLTFGAGFLIEEVTNQGNTTSIFNIGAIIPIFKNGYLVSENWIQFFSNTYTDVGYLFFPSLAVRWNVKRFSFELGPVGVIGDDGDGFFGSPFPHLGISYHFGS